MHELTQAALPVAETLSPSNLDERPPSKLEFCLICVTVRERRKRSWCREGADRVDLLGRDECDCRRVEMNLLLPAAVNATLGVYKRGRAGPLVEGCSNYLTF